MSTKSKDGKIKDTESMKILHEKFIKKNLHKPIKDLPNESYHGLQGAWSSSQFKDLLDDEEIFISKYIKKEVERIERDVFDTGTYFHTAILEPHKVASEIAVYEGKIRRGKEWEKFKALHEGKTIIATGQKQQGDLMVEAVRGSPIAQEYLVGDPEVSLLTELFVWNGKIWSQKYEKLLTKDGWVDFPKPLVDKGYRIVVKVRADTLGETFVSDLKSTSGNARSEESVRGSISKYIYDLSAALYLDMFNLVNPSVKEFIWIFASKGSKSAGTWRATKSNILVGRAKYMRAMIKLADCAQSNWEIVDQLREAEPLSHELDWLREKDTDLL